ncbi:MAG TPA: hypothetical protein VFY69_06425, partial [Solirubrobacterales bacterium]|nr:hypothetical protein [Solirubrobacterales bacterium]
MGNPEEAMDHRLVRALGHPLRLEILRILGERMASPSEMVDLTGERLGNVSYHTKVLLECNCIELVKKEPRRGAVEHFYRAKPRGALGSRPWKKIPDFLRGDATAAALDAFTSRAIGALEAGTFHDREGSTLTWQTLVVDERGWKEIGRIVESDEERVRQIAEKCADRIDDPGAAIPIVVALA